MNYKQYLKSYHWRVVRKQALEYAEHKCQLCNTTKKLNVHHNNYQNVWMEKPRDLIVLCNRCHKQFHKMLDIQFKDIPDRLEFLYSDMWPVVWMDDGTIRKGPRAEIIGRAG